MNTKTTPKEVLAAARVLSKKCAEACNVNADDMWNIDSKDFIADATAALQAAGYLAASGAPQEAPGDAPSDSQMLDWLEKNCTGASNSERYLPFRVYWGTRGHESSKSIRKVISAAMKGPQ